MRSDVTDRAEGAALAGLQPPVPVGVVEEPVLEIVAGDEPDLAQVAGGDPLTDVLVERVEPDVEVDGVDQPARGRLPDEPSRLGGGQGEGLLADDVLASAEDRRRLRHVEVVRRGDVDDVDGRVGENLVERAVGVADAQCLGAGRAALRGAAEDAADVDADPA